MKPLLYRSAVAAVLLGPAAAAQIIITAPDMPAAGDTVRYRRALTTLDAAPAGEGFIWDFSGLVPGAEGADTAVAVGSTPLAYQFFFNNALLYPQHKADLAMRGPSIGLQQFTLSNLFDYYKNNASGYRNVGFGANLNGLPASVQREPVDWIYRFPLNYGDEDSSASHFQVSVPTLGFFGQDQVRHNEVDGWGTLILPADTFEVLRVKSRINRTDTVHVDQFNIGFAVQEPEAIEYKWIAQGMDGPVLQVNVSGGVNTLVRFHYAPEDVVTGLAPEQAVDAFRAWPNPAGEVLHVAGAGSGDLELIAVDGRVAQVIPGTASGMRYVDVRDVGPGSYLLRQAAGGASRRVVIAR